MPELVTDGDVRSIVTPTLRLAFRWAGDRWTHSLEVGPPGWTSLVWPIEGDPDRDDPARVVSPAYQQLEFQPAGSGLQALLVGQSGPHHFSAVFTIEESEGGADLSVDVADRCRAPVESLACTYWVDAVSGDLLEAGPAGIQWSLAPGRLGFVADGPARSLLSEAGRRATRVQALAGLAPGANTHRCLYRWTWRTGASG